MENTLFGLSGAPVMPTAGQQGIEPAPVPHPYLEELSVMGRQEKNPQVYVMEVTAVLEVKQKSYIRLNHTAFHCSQTQLMWVVFKTLNGLVVVFQIIT